eukprot:TRINITY_DN11366_c0_g1_i3.p3 TRINITY_DN11366_c0_g1~~TRINITY_DN11366_c0_g1_i3.p3  ORF type:complete len:225 (+),score=21.18 TRINITY_DN11366_c0_g1_i3:1038-1712(+)
MDQLKGWCKPQKESSSSSKSLAQTMQAERVVAKLNQRGQSGGGAAAHALARPHLAGPFLEFYKQKKVRRQVGKFVAGRHKSCRCARQENRKEKYCKKIWKKGSCGQESQRQQEKKVMSPVLEQLVFFFFVGVLLGQISSQKNVVPFIEKTYISKAATSFFYKGNFVIQLKSGGALNNLIVQFSFIFMLVFQVGFFRNLNTFKHIDQKNLFKEKQSNVKLSQVVL